MLDEWPLDGDGGHDHGGHGNTEIAPRQKTAPGADSLFVINGRSGALIAPLKVAQGDRVRLRLINAGNQGYLVHLQGHRFVVSHADGQPIAGARPLEDTLVPISPGERCDLVFTADHPGSWYLECRATATGGGGMKAAIHYIDHAPQEPPARTAPLPVLDWTAYGTALPQERPTSPERQYSLELGVRIPKEPNRGVEFTLNGKTFPDTEPVLVREGDHVRLHLTNTTEFDHPMHLHGHFFRV